MNIAIILSAYFQVISTNYVKHCTQLVLFEHGQQSHKDRFMLSDTLSFYRNNVANYIFTSLDDLIANDLIVIVLPFQRY